MRSVSLGLALVFGVFSFTATSQESRRSTPALPDTPFNYADIPLPRHLTAPVVANRRQDNSANPVTDAGATLGRVLFYDTRLSANEMVSCATCHRQDSGFSDPLVLSEGFEGEQTARHSMSLAFSAYYTPGAFFWDERASTLEEQVLMPIQDRVEMGMTLEDAVARLESAEFYPALFADAFGSGEITSDRMSRALAQFVRSIVSPNSPYDQARAVAPAGPPGQPLAGLSDAENRGLQLFFGPALCGQCHQGELMVAPEARNNGLDATITDEGAGDGRFKVGSLRNVALTAPYMHDGRFETLEEVVEHYSTGLRDSPGLDPRLRQRNGQLRLLNLSAQEKADIVAFLHTLTDPTLATDQRWADPFTGTSVAAGSDLEDESASLTLAGANPVRGRTAFEVALPSAAPVRLAVYSATGREVAVLVDGLEAAGTTRVEWDASGLAAGVYLVRLTAGAEVSTRTVTVVR